MRPTRYSTRIESLIRNVVIESVNNIDEIFDRKIETNYNQFKKRVDNFDTTVYRFLTKSGTSYDLEFFNTETRTNETLDDGRKLYDVIKNQKPNTVIESVDIGFTLSDVADDVYDHQEYTKNTNKYEHIELMGRLSYLVTEFIKNNSNVLIYVVGKNTSIRKLNIYVEMFKNIFSNDFIMVEGTSQGYFEGAIYFINKKITE
jgi:hypothetical protein